MITVSVIKLVLSYSNLRPRFGDRPHVLVEIAKKKTYMESAIVIKHTWTYIILYVKLTFISYDKL